jgi:hypothetical protein
MTLKKNCPDDLPETKPLSITQKGDFAKNQSTRSSQGIIMRDYRVNWSFLS